MIYQAIYKFNEYINNYPQYKRYLIKYTDYSVGLQQTYLKIFEKKKLSIDKFLLQENHFKGMFIQSNPLLFYVYFYKMMKQKWINHQTEDSKSNSLDIVSSPYTPAVNSTNFGTFETYSNRVQSHSSKNIFLQDNQKLKFMQELLLNEVTISENKYYGAKLSLLFALYTDLYKSKLWIIIIFI